MRKITIEEGLTLRFPARDASFSEGVEIGMLAALMALGFADIARPIAPGSVEQARALAEGFGYRLIETGRGDESVSVLLTRRAARPSLRVIVGGGEGLAAGAASRAPFGGTSIG